MNRAPTTIIGRLSKAAGTSLWVRAFGAEEQGSGVDPSSVACDADSSVVFAGDLLGTVTIAGQTLVATGTITTASAVVVKINADGTPARARQLGGTNSDVVSGIAIDRWSNVLLNGRYSSSDFQVDNLTLAAPASPNQFSFFLLKLTPSLEGRWVQTSSIVSNVVQSQGVGVAPSGNVAQLAAFKG